MRLAVSRAPFDDLQITSNNLVTDEVAPQIVTLAYMPLLSHPPSLPMSTPTGDRQLECSFHVGNRFLGMNVRVFRAPDRASGQLLDTGNGNSSADENEAPFVVEAQLREGDRLHFSALFREIMREFKVRNGGYLWGALRENIFVLLVSMG